jgi:hypothetical protein
MLHRRDAMIRLGQAGTGALALPGLLQAEQTKRANEPVVGRDGTAKNCILVYLWGGPPQQDTFDMKPEAPVGVRSQFSPIETATPGIQICDQLPLTAQQTDKMAIVRSFTHGSNQHEVGVYHTLTGKVNPRLSVPRNQRNRRDFPNAGAVVSRFSKPGVLPASVTIPRPIGHDGVVYSGTYAGFLGPRYDPMELQPPAEVNVPAPHSLDLPTDLSTARLQARRGLLKTLELQDRALQSNPASNSLGMFREQAFRMLMSPDVSKALDVEQEADATRDRYGRNEYGEGFLLARRLIESGVRLVTMTWYYVCPNGNVANVWDNHGGTGSLGKLTGYEMLKAKYCLPPLDLGYSAMLEDLDQRGLLDDTLVVMMGEFGRTPKINKNQGRDHWGALQSIALAGGGIRGGQVYGASDKIAAYPTKYPVSPEDTLATMYHALGLPAETVIHETSGRPNHISSGRPIRALFG